MEREFPNDMLVFGQRDRVKFQEVVKVRTRGVMAKSKCRSRKVITKGGSLGEVWARQTDGGTYEDFK